MPLVVFMLLGKILTTTNFLLPILEATKRTEVNAGMINYF